MTDSAATVLIVDDEISNRKLFETLLQREGYLTRSAASGKEALASVAESAPDLILLDVMMPGMNGYQVAILLKADAATSNIPIIMVTALIDRGARLAGLDAGVEDFLTKPVDPDELSLKMRNLLRLKFLGDFHRNHGALMELEVQARTADLQRFRTAMDATADAITLVSRSTMRFVEVNATACQMLGYTREELFEAGPAQLGAATREELEAAYDALIAGPVANDMTETQLRRKDGVEVQVEVQRRALRSGEDWIIVGVVHDITERKEAEKHLLHLAHHDALTGLPNRVLFYEILRKTLAQSTKNGWLVAVMCADLDHFKSVNDTLGHAVGDELLRQFSDRLVQCVRSRDTVGRLGGDEFALILVVPDGQQGAIVVANNIREALRAPFDLQGHDAAVTTSIGIAMHPDDASDGEILMKYADTAMYRAKQAGRDTFRFFTSQMNIEVAARLGLETALRKAVENGEFVLHYQPKVRLASGRIDSVEALLRWQRPGHGLVAPKDFIPALEETGLIVRVGSWVIAAACRQAAQWLGSPVGPVQISVNVSGRQFVEGDLDGDIVKALGGSGIPADLLELELTESCLMANTERTIASMQSLKKRGVHISIDDFGTGYSSLAYLRRFPLDKLKIDMAFVREITSNPDDAAIALAIISMAHSLRLEVIAEGVETQAQLTYLQRHGCDLIQGYFFSHPLPVPEAGRIIREEKCLPTLESAGARPLRTLLLVDDEPDVLTVLKALLRQDGYHILLARSAAEGFEHLALHKVQVVLCDQRMPVMSGAAFFERIKDLYPDTLRIILSAHTDLETLMESINRGAIHRFFTKPWDNTLLRHNVREAFRHHELLHNASLAQYGTEASELARRLLPAAGAAAGTRHP